MSDIFHGLTVLLLFMLWDRQTRWSTKTTRRFKEYFWSSLRWLRKQYRRAKVFIRGRIERWQQSHE